MVGGGIDWPLPYKWMGGYRERKTYRLTYRKWMDRWPPISVGKDISIKR